MNFEEFKAANTSGIEFGDLTTEEYRMYIFPGNERVVIPEPVALNVSPSGGHRVCDAEGISHYVPKGWLHLVWKVRPDKSHFSF